MKQDIASALCGYLDSLYYTNIDLIKLCGCEAFDNKELDPEKLLLKICNELPRLIPYKFDKYTKKQILLENDGLLEFSNDINYLYSDYTKIFDENYDTLEIIRKTNNKYKHKIHDILHSGSSSGTTRLYNATIKIDEEKLDISCENLIKIIKELNILFDKILKELLENFQDMKTHPYYIRLNRVNYENFNKIYKSDILKEIGKLYQGF